MSDIATTGNPNEGTGVSVEVVQRRALGSFLAYEPTVQQALPDDDGAGYALQSVPGGLRSLGLAQAP